MWAKQKITYLYLYMNKNMHINKLHAAGIWIIEQFWNFGKEKSLPHSQNIILRREKVFRNKCINNESVKKGNNLTLNNFFYYFNGFLYDENKNLPKSICFENGHPTTKPKSVFSIKIMYFFIFHFLSLQ